MLRVAVWMLTAPPIWLEEPVLRKRWVPRDRVQTPATLATLKKGGKHFFSHLPTRQR